VKTNVDTVFDGKKLQKNVALAYSCTLLEEQAEVTLVFTLTSKRLCSILVTWEKGEISSEMYTILAGQYGLCKRYGVPKDDAFSASKIYWWMSRNKIIFLKEELCKTTFVYGNKPAKGVDKNEKFVELMGTFDVLNIWKFGMSRSEVEHIAMQKMISFRRNDFYFLDYCIKNWLLA
jgi:hypothetical protein